MERLDRAFNEAAIRITGKSGDQIAGDDAAVDLVMADLGQHFIRPLDDAELATLAEEFKQLGYPIYTDAIETVEAEGALRDAGVGRAEGAR